MPNPEPVGILLSLGSLMPGWPALITCLLLSPLRMRGPETLWTEKSVTWSFQRLSSWERKVCEQVGKLEVAVPSQESVVLTAALSC